MLTWYEYSESLVICSSFSGTTEEVVENLKQAKNKKCKIIVIASGSALIDFAKKYKYPYYQINPIYNPSKQPRLAIGYSVISQLVMASKSGLVKLSRKNRARKTAPCSFQRLSPKVYADPRVGRMYMRI